MTSTFQLKILLPVLTLSLLANCGGGGGSSSQPTPITTPITPQQLSPTWALTRAAPNELGSTQAEVDAVLSHIFGDQASQSATLVKDGYIIGERFSSGVTSETLGTSWSVAKSFYGAAIGVAIDEGWFQSIDQRASDFLTEWVGTNKEEIRIQQILEMRAGFPENISIYYENDQTQFALNFDKTALEGTSFTYSNPTSQLYDPLLLRATGLDAHAYLREKILTPIGIDTNSIGMWFDRTGSNPITYFGLDMRPVDFAKFGLLFARGGEWNGQQVVPQDYVTASLEAQSPWYGFQWWVLNDAFFGAPTPITVSAAFGLHGQRIYVWPSQDIVLVVHTTYQHAANQGYTLSDTNFPDTCTARNACPDSVGNEVERYNELRLLELLAPLAD